MGTIIQPETGPHRTTENLVINLLKLNTEVHLSLIQYHW